MPKFTEYVALPGSERVAMPEARTIGAADPEEKLQVTVVLRSKKLASEMETAGAAPTEAAKDEARRRASEKMESAMAEMLKRPPSDRQHLSHQQFALTRGAREEEIDQVLDFAHEFGLTVVTSDPARRSVVLAGSVADFSRAFHVSLYRCEHPGGTYRGRTGAIQIPKELDGIVTAVFGLDNRPQARAHFRMKNVPSTTHARIHKHQLPSGTFTPVQVASLYNFPTDADGTGECIAIVELGGGYRATDITNYFQNTLKIAAPKVIAISVDNGQNSPTGDPNSADGEVMLDIEVAGAVAPAAKIAVYFAPNTDQGFIDAISTAIHDTTNNPSVVSISWGGPESTWTQQALTEFNTVLQDAATLGVSVCCAAGDEGSTDGVTDGLQHADFPASSPYALACGGTKLTASGTSIASEVVWNETANNEGATGGGISAVFAKPDYQANANVPVSANPGGFVGRGLPDVAGNADPSTGYDVLVDGQTGVVGGTSAVAPLWAGLIVCVNQKLGKRVGDIVPLLYTQIANATTFHDVTSGNNGAYKAAPGWDPCTGWGSPDGAAIASALTGKTAAKK